MNPLRKLFQFFINLSSQKTKLNKIPSLNKVSQKASPIIQIKVEHKQQAAIASSLSAEIYNLEILKQNIQDEKNNVTRFLLMGKEIYQPELKDENYYITSFLFKLKSKPAALYSALSGFAINGVNMTKLQSFPEKNSFSSFFFLCDIEGHIDDQKIKNSLKELGLHCEDMHVLGVFNSDKFRQK